MSTPTLFLSALRANAPAITPEQFLRYQPGCFIQYFDDTPAKDSSKALSADRYDSAVAARKQAAHISVCYSLQAFQKSRTKEGFLCHRNMGVDVDLGDNGEIDRAKQVYLADVLARFPLGPHWLTETAHGFHLVFRVVPTREPASVVRAEALNRRLVRTLLGDEHAAILTQVFRVPGTLQFKDPANPYRCRLLLDLSGTTPPYTLDRVEQVLADLEAANPFRQMPPSSQQVGPSCWRKAINEVTANPDRQLRTFSQQKELQLWRQGLNGVREGQRNAVATSLIGRIVHALPMDLWATAGWGGLKEWNLRNSKPLSEPELRAVYDSITRRERAKASQPGERRNDRPGERHSDEAGRGPVSRTNM